MTAQRMRRIAAVVLVVLGLSGAVAGAGARESAGDTTGPTVLPVGDTVEAGGITREVLESVAPPNGPGQALYGTRVVIAPGAEVAAHFHDGTNVARVARGTLAYEVISGSALVDRADGTQRTFTAPAELTLHEGDVVNELPGMVHRAENRTTRKVVTETVALLAAHAGLSTPVDSEGATTTLSTGSFVLAVDRSDVTPLGADGVRTYGTVVEHGTADVDGETVRVDLTVQVDYTNGSGPFTGLLTLTWPDGSTLGTRMAGATRAGAPTDTGAEFSSVLGVLGGTGRWEGVTGGTGTYDGGRPGAIGAPLTVTVELRVNGV